MSAVLLERIGPARDPGLAPCSLDEISRSISLVSTSDVAKSQARVVTRDDNGLLAVLFL